MQDVREQAKESINGLIWVLFCQLTVLFKHENCYNDKTLYWKDGIKFIGRGGP